MRRSIWNGGVLATLAFALCLTGAQGCSANKHERKSGESAEEEDEGDEADEADEASEEKPVELAAVPAAVRASIERITREAKLDRITHENDGGLSVYEAEYTKDGAKCSADLTDAGDVLELERGVAANALPAAASKALKAKSPDATIKKVESVALNLYEIHLTTDGKTHAVLLKPNGAAFGRGEEEEEGDEGDEADEKQEKGEKAEAGGEKPVDLAQTPQPVRSAIERVTKDGKVTRVTHEDDEGVSMYEVEYTQQGAECSAAITDQGEVTESERTVAASALPAAITSAIATKYKGSTIAKAERLELHYFEVAVSDGAKTHTVKVFANGEIWDEDED
jgi:hypothetical protein